MSNPPLYSPARENIPPPSYDPINLEHFCAPVIHPTTGKIISKHKELANGLEMSEVWRTAFVKEFGGLDQGDSKTGEKGSNPMFVLDHEEIKNIPKDRKVTYGQLVVDYREQKEDPKRVRLTTGGNLIKYLGKTTTKTANLTTSKVLRNSILSTALAKLMCIDIKSFYLCTPMD